jgi:hypothetical protein
MSKMGYTDGLLKMWYVEVENKFRLQTKGAKMPCRRTFTYSLGMRAVACREPQLTSHFCLKCPGASLPFACHPFALFLLLRNIGLDVTYSIPCASQALQDSTFNYDLKTRGLFILQNGRRTVIDSEDVLGQHVSKGKRRAGKSSVPYHPTKY